MKIIVSAYACHPELGSEPGMGWNWVREIARRHDVWLLTEAERFAPAVATWLASDATGLAARLHVVPVSRTRSAEFVPWFGYYRTYRRWHRDAYAAASRLHARIGFDLAHQLNMIGYREPGELWRLPIPFAWGPVGGFSQAPWTYLPALGGSGLPLAARNVANAMQMRWSRRVQRAAARAAILLAASSTDRDALRRFCGVEARVENETGTEPSALAPERAAPGPGQPLRVLCVGLQVPRKAWALALAAVAAARHHCALELTMVGSGADEARLRARARVLGIDDLVRWTGWLPRAAVQHELARAHVLLFPSLVEGTPHVVLEALSQGVPVICHRLSGQGDVVDESCGRVVAPLGPRHSVDEMAAALVELATQPEAWSRRSAGAHARAAAQRWSSKAERLVADYERVVSAAGVESGQRPEPPSQARPAASPARLPS